jgi:glycosyltransferase involved in cell wall biosynthesis
MEIESESVYRQKIKVLHYGAPPITYGSPSFYKFVKSMLSEGRMKAIPSFYPDIFDVEYFGWIKRAFYKVSTKKVYLLDFPILISTLVKKAVDKDLIITLGFPAIIELLILIFIAKIRNIPIFVRDTHWYWPQTRISRFIWPIYFKLLKLVDGIIYPGLASYNYWRRYGLERVYIVHYYALEATMMECNLSREEARRILNIRNYEIVVLYLGRLVKKKGVDVIILAFSRLIKENPTLNVKLLIAGDGPERKRLEEISNQLKLTDKVVFLGAVPEEIKKCIYKAADIFIYVPIVTEIPEEWPIAPLEAMSLGIPTIVSTAVGSLPDILHGVVAVKWGDVEELYKAMREIIENRMLKDYLGKVAFHTYKTLASEIRVKIELLDAIIDSLKRRYER